MRSILSLSDIHIGHRHTKAEFILENLARFFNHFKIKHNFDNLKVILIAGDLWDDAIQFADPAIAAFFRFWFKFTRWCETKKIVLRLMEGTPKHDRLQGRNIIDYTKQVAPNLDFRFIDKIEVEKHQGLGLSFLYVPDEATPSAETTYQGVLEALASAGVKQVDIGVMHGMFEYQLGNIPSNAKVHSEKRYQEIVRQFIVIGHIHTRSTFGNIYAQGSFDRIAHNEATPKGGWYFTEQSDHTWAPLFIENKNAKQYVTYVIEKPIEKALKTLQTAMAALPDDSHVCIKAASGHPILQAVDQLKSTFRNLHITKKVIKEPKEEKKTTSRLQYNEITLNRETLTEAIFNEIMLVHDLDLNKSKKLHALLESMHS